MIFDLYDKDDVALVKRAFEGRTLGLTSGAYDMMHALHEQYLNGCRRYCGPEGALIVGVDSDQLVRATKGDKRPVVPELDRLQTVAGRKGVAAAFILGTSEDFGRASELLGARLLFKNQAFEKIPVFGADRPGVKLIIVPDVHRTESTSALIEKVIQLHAAENEVPSHTAVLRGQQG